MTGNFTLQDLFGILRVLPFFALVLLAPGYLVGLASNAFEFRIRGVSERILLSLALSCAIVPYFANILCRFFSVRAVSLTFLLIGLAFLGAIFGEWRRSSYRLRFDMHWSTKTALCMVAAWVFLCLVSLPDIQMGDKLYSTAATYDHSVRSAFIASAVRTGSPPANPFFYPGAPVPARYYYYWNVLCAIPAYLSAANVRVVLYASCIWSGLCLVSIIPIYLKHFLERESNLRLATIFGMGLIAITGLDLIPILVIWLFPTPPFADMEWWDPVQVASWFDSLLWVPHHVAALVACLVGFLLLWKAVPCQRRFLQALLLVLSAMSFSSAAGLSVYVTFTFAIFLLAWVVYLLARGRFVAALLHGAVGLLAVLMSIGYLADLRGHGAASGAAATSFFALTLRMLPVFFAPFIDVFSQLHWSLGIAAHLVFIIPTMFLELGIYLAVGVFHLKQDWKQRRELPETQRCLWIMAASALMVILFLRSTVIGSNDLAWRGALVLQFVLLLWTAIYLSDRVMQRPLNASRNWNTRISLSKGFAILILIGGLSSFYQLFMLRSYTFLSDAFHWQKSIILSTGRESFLIRSANAELDRNTPFNAIVQYNPASKLAVEFMTYSRYQLVDASSSDCGTAFGGSLDQCHIVDGRLSRIFNPSSGDNFTQTEVARLCRSLKIDDLLINARDPIWSKQGSWVWQVAPVVQNDFVRIYRCDRL